MDKNCLLLWVLVDTFTESTDLNEDKNDDDHDELSWLSSSSSSAVVAALLLFIEPGVLAVTLLLILLLLLLLILLLLQEATILQGFTVMKLHAGVEERAIRRKIAVKILIVGRRFM